MWGSRKALSYRGMTPNECSRYDRVRKPPIYNRSKILKAKPVVDLKLLGTSLMGNRILSVSEYSPPDYI